MTEKRPFYLAAWRRYRNLTQQELADALDTSKGYISDLERGKRRYNQDLLEALAKALSCEPADFLIRNPEDPSAIWRDWLAQQGVPEADQERFVAVIEALKQTAPKAPPTK